MNENISDCFEKYANLLSVFDESQFKIRAYRNGAKTIRELPFPVDQVDYTKLKGIGKGLSEKITIYINNQKCEFLDILISELENEYGKDKLNAVLKFLDIKNIGPAKAKQLVFDENILTIEELNTKENLNILTSAQKLGVKYYIDSKEKIPRNITTKHLRYLKTSIGSIVDNIQFVGSYRRGAEYNNDIDVLLVSEQEPQIILGKIYNKLKNVYISDVISMKERKMMIYANLNSDTLIRRVDFYVTNKMEFPFALLHWTGSKEFNIALRKIALKNKYTLSEHSIKSIQNGSMFLAKSENDIFSLLNLGYVPPRERTGTVFKSGQQCLRNAFFEYSMVLSEDMIFKIVKENNIEDIYKNYLEDLVKDKNLFK